MSGAGARGELRTRRARDVRVFLVAAVVGLVVSPVLSIYAALLGAPVGIAAWAISRGRPGSSARWVAVAAAGLLAGTAVYFLLALVVGVFGDVGGRGSGSN